MKVLTLVITIAFLGVSSVSGQSSCLDPSALKTLDSKWEKALLESDAEFLRDIMAEEFIWVHNHAGTIDTKAGLLRRATDPSRGATGSPRSRKQSDVEARVLGSTGVVTGFTLVDRGPSPTRYSFMRTYVEVDGHCILLANQTMASPESEN